jgi:hypothetical protein
VQLFHTVVLPVLHMLRSAVAAAAMGSECTAPPGKGRASNVCPQALPGMLLLLLPWWPLVCFPAA